ncbi:MAG: PEP-CTERM sorting domain-containing protein [Pirellulales bacterium]|nr:PEP-CTERM sorting domain-containing protein [Pirellulales bacterium]
MKRSRVILLVWFATLSLVLLPSTAHAAVIGTGDIQPALSEWDETKTCYVGQYQPGTLTVDDGSDLASKNVSIGYYGDGVGDVTMTGAGTTWQCINDISVGVFTSGTMAITDGAAFVAGGTTRIASLVGSSGTLHLDTGGSLTTKTLAARPIDLSGSGTIHARGLVADLDFVFDSPASLHQAILLDDQPGQNITIDLDMSNPANNGWLGAGYRARGSTTITGTAEVTSAGRAYIGMVLGSHGTLTVDGPDARWTHLEVDMFNRDIDVGYYGEGYLNILNGGQVTGGYSASVGHQLNGDSDIPSYGRVTISGNNSKWSGITSLMIGRGGNGDVEVLDGGELAIIQSCNIGYNVGYGTMTVRDAGSRLIVDSAIHTGYLNETHGTFRILNGGYAESRDGIISVFDDGIGEVVIRGSGSTWTVHEDLHVARSGVGQMTIADGGVVTCKKGTVGNDSTGNGWALVYGDNSRWTSSVSLKIGNSGRGILSIADGGTVSAPSVSIGNSQSLLAIEVSNDSLLSVNDGLGTITNNGTMRFIAGAAAQVFTYYTPVSASTWSGSGTIETLGGTWIPSLNTFTPSTVAVGSSGTPITLEVSSTQRMMVNDVPSGWALGASFRATPSFELLYATATAIDGTVLDDLEEHLYEVESVLGGWLLDASGGYASGDPIYLSFDIGGGYSADELQPWYFTGTEWMEYDTTDFVYDGTYASFTVDVLAGFAVTTVVEITLPGDANGDGQVDADDARRLAANWLQPGGWAQGDFNGDGIVNDLDASILAAHWGDVAESQSVPEPSTWVLAAFGLLGLAVFRRRRGR